MVSVVNMTSKSSIILQYAKTPELGKVKTRLFPVLSPEQATVLHKNLLTHVADVAAQIEGVHHQLWSTAGGAFLEGLAKRFSSEHYLQAGADLGERLAYGVEKNIPNYDAVILIGSDCPYLDKEYYQNVLEQLFEQNIDVVIGPAFDGGYVLLAVKEYHPVLFQEISWGSDQVFEQTLDKAEQSGLTVKQHKVMGDIDRPDDLRDLRANVSYAHLCSDL